MSLTPTFGQTIKVRFPAPVIPGNHDYGDLGPWQLAFVVHVEEEDGDGFACAVLKSFERTKYAEFEDCHQWFNVKEQGNNWDFLDKDKPLKPEETFACFRCDALIPESEADRDCKHCGQPNPSFP